MKVAASAIKKLKVAVKGKCPSCEKIVSLEYHDLDTKQSLCNECAGHYAVAEFWLRHNRIFPCTRDMNDRGTSLV